MCVVSFYLVKDLGQHKSLRWGRGERVLVFSGPYIVQEELKVPTIVRLW